MTTLAENHNTFLELQDWKCMVKTLLCFEILIDAAFWCLQCAIIREISAVQTARGGGVSRN